MSTWLVPYLQDAINAVFEKAQVAMKYVQELSSAIVKAGDDPLWVTPVPFPARRRYAKTCKKQIKNTPSRYVPSTTTAKGHHRVRQ